MRSYRLQMKGSPPILVTLPPGADYQVACRAGVRHAAEFIEWLADNPEWIGGATLERVIAELAATRGDPDSRGYAVGFCAEIERCLARAS